MSSESIQPASGEKRPTIWEWILIVMLPIAVASMVAREMGSLWRHLTNPSIYGAVFFISALAYWYLTVFAIWHWRTRYAGKRPFAWAIFFVYSLFLLPTVCYFFAHILPDIRRRGPYAPSAPPPTPPQQPPSKRETMIGFCFVAGWVLIFWTLLAAIANMVAYAVILPTFANCISANAPKEFSLKIAASLMWIVKMYAFTVFFLGFCCVGAGVGGWFLYASQQARIEVLEQSLPLAPIDCDKPRRDSLLVRIEQALREPSRVLRFLIASAFLFIASFAAMWSFGSRLLDECNRFDSALKPVQEKTSIVVASADLLSGSILTTNNMAKKSFLLTNWTASVIEPDQYKLILGLHINRPVKYGEPIYWPYVLPPTNSAVKPSK